MLNTAFKKWKLFYLVVFCMRYVCVVFVVPVQLVDMCQYDLSGNWTQIDPEHNSNIITKETKLLCEYKHTVLQMQHLFVCQLRILV
jgi:hypothetical protein